MFRWIYPTTCTLCHEASDAELCPECAEKLPRVPRPICLYCGAPVAGDAPDPYHCDDCKGKVRSFDFARSALERTETTMELVHDLKYHKASYLAKVLAPMLAELWERTPELRAHEDWSLVPVPVTRKRLFNLGYNHAEELARALGRLMDLPIVHPLQRKRTSASSQTRLSATERMKNAFQAYGPHPAFAEGRRTLPPNLLVIDDVYTTGATVRACAKALKALPGVKTVGALTLVRI